MYTAKVTTPKLFSCIFYMLLFSEALSSPQWGVLANYLPRPATEGSQQRQGDNQMDEIGTGSSFLSDNDILNSLKKLHILAMGDHQDMSPGDANSIISLPAIDEDDINSLEEEDESPESAEGVKRLSSYTFQGSRGKKFSANSFMGSRGKRLPVEDKKAHASLSFMGSRGKRLPTTLEKKPRSLGFVGSRGKKSSPLSFNPTRGRRQLSTAFMGSRGRRVSAQDFAASRRRRVNSQAFMGSRGKKYSSIGFMGSRGKRDPTFDDLLNNQNEWPKDNYERRASAYSGFVPSRGKRSTESNSDKTMV